MKTSRLAMVLKWLLLAVLAGACNYFVLDPLLEADRHVLLLDSLFSGAVLAVLAYLLRRSTPESMASLGYFHRILYYCALGLLFVTIWLAAEAALLEISFPGSAAGFLTAAPLKIVTGMLVYMSLLLTRHRAEHDEITNTGNDARVATADRRPGTGSGAAGAACIASRSGKVAEVAGFAAARESGAAPALGASAPTPTPVPATTAARPAETMAHVSVRNGARIELIDIADIMVLEAEGDYVRIITEKGRFLKEQTMKYFEENLSPETFVRVHRSAIVNIRFISRIETYEKQKYISVMRGGQRVRMSQNGYRLLKDALNL